MSEFSRGPLLHSLAHLRPAGALELLQIVGSLQVQPVARIHAKEYAQSHCCLDSDRPLPRANAQDLRLRDASRPWPIGSA